MRPAALIDMCVHRVMFVDVRDVVERVENTELVLRSRGERERTLATHTSKGKYCFFFLHEINRVFKIA